MDDVDFSCISNNGSHIINLLTTGNGPIRPTTAEPMIAN